MVVSTTMAYGLVLACVLTIATGQLMFKAMSSRILPVDVFLRDYKAMAILGAALLLYAVSTVAWIFALRVLPLSKAYMVMACSFLIIPVAAHFLFNEPLTINVLLGALMIMVGIWITTL